MFSRFAYQLQVCLPGRLGIFLSCGTALVWKHFLAFHAFQLQFTIFRLNCLPHQPQFLNSELLLFPFLFGLSSRLVFDEQIVGVVGFASRRVTSLSLLHKNASLFLEETLLRGLYHTFLIVCEQLLHQPKFFSSAL